MNNKEPFITAEISLYPLKNDYEDVIIRFIKKVADTKGIDISVNGMSTQICGQTSDVFKVIQMALTDEFQANHGIVAVVKYLNKPIKPGQNIDIKSL